MMVDLQRLRDEAMSELDENLCKATGMASDAVALAVALQTRPDSSDDDG